MSIGKKKIAPIIITGTQHSGIGQIAHYLKTQGIFVGSKFVTTDPKSHKGFYENTHFVELHNKMFAEAEVVDDKLLQDWGYYSAERINPEVLTKYIPEANSLVHKFQNGIAWGWADSRTTLALDFWESICDDAKYILVYKNPWEIKNSIEESDNSELDKYIHLAHEVWRYHNSSLLDFYNNNKDKCILVNYHRFIQKPEAIIDLVKNKLGVNIESEQLKNYDFYKADIEGSRNVYDEYKKVVANKDIYELFKTLEATADMPADKQDEELSGMIEKLSVVITTYNDAELLPDAIVSVEKSLNKGFELIIVNDGTTESSSKAVLKKLKDAGYTILNKDNGGPSSARNAGIKAAKGEYVLMLDADDVIETNYINKSLKHFVNNAETGVVYCNPRLAGTEHRLSPTTDFSIEKLLSGNFISLCSVVRKKAWQDAGGFDESLKGYEDWDLWIGIYKHGWKFHHIDEYLFEYRMHDNSVTTQANIPERRYELVKYITNKHSELYKEHATEIATLLQKDTAILQSVIDNLNNQVKTQSSIAQHDPDEMPSKLGQFRELTTKVKTVLTSPGYAPGDKNKFWQRLRFLFSFGGAMLVRKFFKVLFKYAYILLENQKVIILLGDKLVSQSLDRKYNYWLVKNAPREVDFKHYKDNLQYLSYQPKISLVVPVYNTPTEFLIQMIESVQEQIYPNWELCIADDNSPKEEVRDLIKSYAEKDSRIKYVFRKENGHISKTSNSAIELATGEFTGLLDHDDLLTHDALYQVVFELNHHPETDFIYTDEDKIDDKGYLSDPHFKPEWCPDNLLTRNYITHFAVMRTSILKEIGGFRVGFEGSQDYDLFLRYTEKTDKIRHIPKVLYHWRMHDDSTAKNSHAKDYAFTAGKRAIQEAIERRNEPGEVDLTNLLGFYKIDYDLVKPGKVSIIIPSKNKADLLKVCLDSIYAHTTYDNFEVILIDNNSDEESFFQLVDDYKTKDNFKYFSNDMPFNFAALMNFAVEKATGDYILLLNNDTEVIIPDWLEQMIKYAQRDSIGVVGTKLLYPNETVQHAGVIMGVKGLSTHAFLGRHKNAMGYFNYLNTVSNFSAVTGACMMFRRELFDKVNGFDEEFAVEYNDIDFCLRVREEGYNNVMLPHVVLYHHESISRGNPLLNKKAMERHLKELDRFQNKWTKYIEKDPCYNPNLTKDKVNFEIGA